MSDKLHGGIKASRSSVSLPIELRKSTDSIELTGKVYTDVSASYWRQGGTRTAITMATLSGPSASYSSGGFVEVDATNMPGVYRFDVPDAAFATGADWVLITLKVSTAFVQHFMFALETKGAADLNDIAATAIVSGGAIATSAGAVSSVTLTGTVTTFTGYTAPPTAAANASAVRAELATELGRIDTTIGSRMAAFTLPTNFAALSISGAGALTLTPAERTAVANEVEAQIIDETDSERVLTAITDKIASTNPSLTGLTLSAIASAVRTNLATELARIDTTIGSRSTYAGGPVASVTAPVTLAATQVFNNTGTWTGNLLGTVSTVSTLTNLPAAPADWLGAAAVSTGAVTKIQNGLSTYAGGDTAGVTKLVSTLELISGSSYRFKAAALTNVAGGGGGGGASLPQETIDALNGAAQILLATLYVPPESPTPVVVVPYVPSISGRML